jgi:hypothetical protein
MSDMMKRLEEETNFNSWVSVGITTAMQMVVLVVDLPSLCGDGAMVDN